MTGCPSGKIAYPSPQAAHRALTHLRRRQTTRLGSRRRRRTHGDAYRCGACKAWHTTSRGN
jgi:epoxyqueuosine reductase QueG